MKALITNNHFSPYCGSSLVAIEVAEYLQSLGYAIEICGAFFSSPLLDYIEKKKIPYSTIDNPPDPNDFDIIWSQNHILSAILYKLNISLSDKPKIYSVALSPYDSLEVPNAIVEISQFVLANSYETAQSLIQKNILPRKIKVFNNAAPSSFNQKRQREGTLKSILAVANHAPVEIEDALNILNAQGIIVNKVGFWGNQRLVTPEMILQNDAVVTIGKTVQYSLLSETPIYIYDRFGGPGWLNEQNFNRAMQYNFSGRCTSRSLTAEAIADEILTKYSEAAYSILNLKKMHYKTFSLDKNLQDILNNKKQFNIKAKLFKKYFMHLIRREGALAYNAAINYAELQKKMIEANTLKIKNNDLKNILQKNNIEN